MSRPVSRLAIVWAIVRKDLASTVATGSGSC